MTASELIAALSALPPDTPIYVHNSEWNILWPATLTPTAMDVSRATRRNSLNQPIPNSFSAHECYYVTDTSVPCTDRDHLWDDEDHRIIHLIGAAP